MRWAVLVASCIVQACLGSVYAWSVFVPLLQEAYGYSSTQTQLVFSVAVASFTLVMIPAGRLEARLGPRPVAIVGGVLFGLGYCLGGWGAGSLGLLVLGLGFLQGAGIGFGYVCPLATCVKWFPHHKGLVTGVSVAGFGGGAIILTFLAEELSAAGVPVGQQFVWIGLGYGVIAVLSACVLQAPPGEPVAVVHTQQEPLRIIVRQPVFWSLFVGMLTGTFAGLLVIGNLKPIGLTLGLPENVAAAGVGLLAIGNAAGRIVWGKFYDLWHMRTIPAKLVWLFVCMLLLLAAADTAWLYFAACVLIGGGFGGCFVLYASAVSELYGSARLGSVYPWIFPSYGLAAFLGPMLGGAIADSTGSFSLAIVAASALCLVGMIGFLLLHRRTHHTVSASQ